MTVANERTTAQRWQSLLVQQWTWTLRTAAGFVALSLWMFVALGVTAMLLPGLERGGLQTEFAVPNLFLAMSIGYYFVAIPALCLPLESEHRFRWFLYLECGWVLCLLGAIIGLFLSQKLAVNDFKTPYSFQAATTATAGLFLIPMLIVLMTNSKGHRRLATVVGLLFTWLAVQGAGFALFDRFAVPNADQVKLLLPITALLISGLTVTLLLPASADARHDWSLLMIFAWSFLVVCMFIGFFHYETIEARGDSSYANFVGIAAALLIAPVFSWLGMPWANKNRLLWTLCLFAATIAVFYFVTQAPAWDGSPPLQKLWSGYRGAHL